MKYLKQFNESINNLSFTEIVEDIKDIFIDLDDFGFKVDISVMEQTTNKNIKFIHLYVTRSHDVFIHNDNEFYVFHETLIRLNKYLSNKGLLITTQNPIFNLILKGDKSFLNTHKNDVTRVFTLIEFKK